MKSLSYVNKCYINEIVFEIGSIFEKAGFELSLVGGSVRDIFLSKKSNDLDFASNATPNEIIQITKKWKDHFYNYGKRFGTIGIIKKKNKLEITTYRIDKYKPSNRKPKVTFCNNLENDLLRRDFTINAMALKLPNLELIDPYGGLKDLRSNTLKTPLIDSKKSLLDDPLRMIRAARFISQFKIQISPALEQIILLISKQIKTISKERIRDELMKLMQSNYPQLGIDFLVRSKLAKYILPEVYELNKIQNKEYKHKNIYKHSLIVLKRSIFFEKKSKTLNKPNFILRFAALMHDVGKPSARRIKSNNLISFRHHEVIGSKMVGNRMKILRFNNLTIKLVTKLIKLHMRFYGYSNSKWTDAAVRRYVNDAGFLLDTLHCLVKSDVTTKNKQKSTKLLRNYRNLEIRIKYLKKKEKLDLIRPDLNGIEIMNILKITPGILVGKAYKFLLNERFKHGTLSKQNARMKLIKWWKDNSLS